MNALTSAPVLSTPETHIFEDPTPILAADPSTRLTDAEIQDVYEISRTAQEIIEGGWKRVALQFPDSMLRDGTRVFEALEKALSQLSATLEEVKSGKQETEAEQTEILEKSFNKLSTEDTDRQKHRLYILADTSYGACCVDEIAAEHVDAEVVVHYGRSCLSPTARLPVIYVFTSHSLDLDKVVQVFETTYESSGKEAKIILMADITYDSHIPALYSLLQSRGWTNIIAPSVIHNPSSAIPNRKIDIEEDEMKSYSLFHISDPPPALLLTLNSRVLNLHIYPTSSSSALPTNTSMTLRRRYALLTSLSTTSIFGILINTLSVRSYLETVSSIRAMIAAAGKKSYTFVVGKINAAKVANFAEIGGWVVIGCWESSLIESAEFWRPIITPYELRLALMSDEERVWSGEWRGDFESLDTSNGGITPVKELSTEIENEQETAEDSDEESAPPEFDLRTGRYVSHSRPMRASKPASSTAPAISESQTQTLIRRDKGELATVNGVVSPGAEYLRSQRTWTGLGSDFHEEEAPEGIKEGRSGIARGYTVGEGEKS